MPYPETATGFMIESQKDWKNFKKQEVRVPTSDCQWPSITHSRPPQFKLKPFEDRDIDIAIDACGVCASDVHSISGGWGEVPLPLCVGHEVVGRAVKVGKDVKTIK